MRPGVAEGQAVLLPLEKGRAGEDAPTFVVRITYLQPVEPWLKTTTARLDLPALDLPVSRTGVELYHSPRFRVEPQPGAFRIESDPGVFAEALRDRRLRLRPQQRRLRRGAIHAVPAPRRCHGRGSHAGMSPWMSGAARRRNFEC